MPSAVQAATPTLTVSRNSATYTENDAGFHVDSGMQIAYSDTDTINGAKVSIGMGFSASQDQLLYSTTAGIVGSYNGTTGVLTLTGAALASSYQAALRSVRYYNSSDNPTTASRVITFSLSGGSLYNEMNGHYYEYVSASGIIWTDACTEAGKRSLFGLQGYLATITSSQENDFLTAKLSGTTWIGASDAAEEGVWRWVIGPEDGHLLSEFYTNWNTGEPNNSGNEDYGHMMSSTVPPGKWNDLPNIGGAGYMVEYGGMSEDPVVQLSGSVTVTVQPVDDAPVTQDCSLPSILENRGSIQRNVIVSDVDTFSALTYSVVTPPTKGTARFNGNTVTYSPYSDANGMDSFTFKANDGMLDSNISTATITITPVNDCPSFAKGGDQMVGEDCGPRTVSGWATNISAGPSNESGQTLNFNVTNSNNSLFAVPPAVAANGTLTYTPAANANGTATVTLTLTDDATAGGPALTSAPQTFTIAVSPVNDLPVNMAPPSIAGTMNVGDTVTASVGTWNDAVDTAVSGTSTLTCAYQWVRSDDASGTNAVDVASATSSSYILSNSDAHKYLRVRVTCTDNGVGLPVTQSVTLSTPWTSQVINRLPVITEGASTSVTMDEDGSPLAWNLILYAADADKDTLTWGILTQALHGTAPASGTGTAKAISYTPFADWNGSDSFVVQVSDGYGGTNDITMSVTVNPINDAPSFTKGADQTVLEDCGPQTVTGWATAISAGPIDEAGQALTFILTNSNNTLFSTQPAVSSTGTLTYTPSANMNGTATVTVSLHDDGGTANGGVDTSAFQTFTITVTAVNDVPSFTAGVDQTVLEDCGAQTVANWATSYSAGPADGAGQALDFIVTNDNNALFSIRPAVSPTGTLTYTPAANQNGSATVSVRIHDNGSTLNGGVDTSAFQTFTIAVTAVNDPPVNKTLPVIAGNLHVGRTLTTTPGDWNDVIDTNVSGTSVLSYAYQWQRSTDGGTVFADVEGATGSSYTLALPDNLQRVRVKVTCSDRGVGGPIPQSTTVFSLPLTILNAAPIITEGPAVSTSCDEDESPAPFGLVLHAVDPDIIDTLRWRIAVPPTHGTLALPADPIGSVTVPVYHPVPNWNGTDSFTLRVEDGLTSFDEVAAMVIVNPINDAPICLALPHVTGPAVVGTTITADAGLWDDHRDQEPGHIGLQVQWLRATTAGGSSAQAIPDVTGLTYEVREVDVGFFLGVRVIVTDDGEGLPRSMQTSAEGNFIQAFDRDRIPPTVQFLHPLSTTVTASKLLLQGTIRDVMSGVRSLSIDGVPVIRYADGTFRYDLVLKKGDNVFLIAATDNAGNQWTQTYHVTYAPPVLRPVSGHALVLIIGSKTMTVDGARVALDAPAALVEDRTLVPLRAVVEHLGGSIAWNARTRQVTLKARGTTVLLTIGKATALVNGKSLAIDPKNSKVFPMLSSGRTMLPLRFVAENLGLQVGWNAKTKAVTLTWDD